jgi:hypothetical protein
LAKAPYYWTAIPICIDNFRYYFVYVYCTALRREKGTPE